MSSCLKMPQPSPRSDAAVPTTPAALYEIGTPYGLRHDVHIRYNYAEARFEGVPDNFLEFLASPTVSRSSSARSSSRDQLTPSAKQSGKLHAKRMRVWSLSKDASDKKLPPQHKQDVFSPHPPAPDGGGGGSGFGSGSGFDSDRERDVNRDAILLNQQFRVHFRQVPRAAIAGYENRIPAVLVMLQQQFLLKRGFLVPHIFRESPSKADRDVAMHEINHGTFSGTHKDVRVFADLIKVWFRELPVPILHDIPCDQMEKLSHMEDTVEEVARVLGGLELSVVYWLADLLAHVAEHEDVNHMGIQQLAIIVAPNLVRIETENPMVAVAMSKASVDVFLAILRARVARRRQLVADAAAKAFALAQAGTDTDTDVDTDGDAVKTKAGVTEASANT